MYLIVIFTMPESYGVKVNLAYFMEKQLWFILLCLIEGRFCDVQKLKSIKIRDNLLLQVKVFCSCTYLNFLFFSSSKLQNCCKTTLLIAISFKKEATRYLHLKNLLFFLRLHLAELLHSEERLLLFFLLCKLYIIQLIVNPVLSGPIVCLCGKKKNS